MQEILTRNDLSEFNMAIALDEMALTSVKSMTMRFFR